MDNFYITTTLPYVNALPHIGHTLEFVQADVIARYMRMVKGEDSVFFNIGTDEHGLKIYLKAKEEGLDTQVFVDKYVAGWKDFCSRYGISYDNFYRTSDTKHIALAQRMWSQLMESGNIYKKTYKGLYCVGCEAFKTDKELVDGKCPDHAKEPVEMEEENYFLRLSTYSEAILKHIATTGVFVKSEEKQHHLVNFLKEGLQDISVSRVKEKMPWGIPIPGDDQQVMYVWLDALSNYIFAVGALQDEKRFASYWPGVQICGPDNLKFQGAIWQGILAAMNLPFSKKILVHGMINAEDGRKMSKSLGNVVSPFDLLDTYPLEAIRYYLALGIPTYDDASFSYARLVDLYNDGLADKYGNLLNRVIHLANKFGIDLADESNMDSYLQTTVDTARISYEQHMERFEISLALQEIYQLTMKGNEYITIKEPWAKGKSVNEVSQTLRTLAYLLRVVIKGYMPVLIETSEKANSALAQQTPIILFTKIEG